MKIDSLSFSYPDGGRILESISLNLEPGKKMAVVGANGAGKSTLLALIAGIYTPESGTVAIGDTAVDKKTMDKARSMLGFVFQDPDDQLFSASVYDDVAFGPRNQGLEEPVVRSRVEAALKTVGIPDLAKRPPFRLSGGEKRMAAIATVLSMDPGLLILDEPSASLDPKARRRLIHLLTSLPQTILVATHDLDMALELCDEIAVLHDGALVAIGLASIILKDERLLDRCGLELPLSMQACPVCGLVKPATTIHAIL
ncbi:ABC transporter ATP-binding protein [Spirochaetota bacterium]